VGGGAWTFGVPSFIDFVTKTKQYTMEGIAGQIQCPCLVLQGDADMFFLGQPQQIYDALQVPKLPSRKRSVPRCGKLGGTRSAVARKM